MGFVSSPYTAVPATLMAEEKIKGNPSDPSNVFKWDKVILNLPGSLSYKPSDPWVYKARVDDSNEHWVIANDFNIYVDDVRTIGSKFDAWPLG